MFAKHSRLASLFQRLTTIRQPPRKTATAEERQDLLDAYRELHDAEKRTGARINCARGADMSDPATVRRLARVLDYIPGEGHGERAGHDPGQTERS